MLPAQQWKGEGRHRSDRLEAHTVRVMAKGVCVSQMVAALGSSCSTQPMGSVS